MSWDAIGAIGDLVGGFAVVISLVYVATQVRHSAQLTADNTREVSAAAIDAIFAGFSQWRQLVAEDRLTRVFMRGCNDLSDLSREEQFQFGLLMQELLFANQRLFSRGLDGSSAIPPTVALQNAASVLVRPGAHDWWTRHSGTFMPEFSTALSASIEAIQEERDGATAVQASS